MALTLMYITNHPVTASIAQMAGVDRIWIDMEYIGKEDRQRGMNTVKSHHTIEDIYKIRPIVTSSQLLVRVNPIHNATKDYCDSKEEIENTIRAGADVIMLPYFKNAYEVEQFIEYVDGRATTQLLLETKEAVDTLDDVLSISGIDEVHIGLNDLHLCYNQKFMFELLCDGTVERICSKVKQKGIKYGFGGIARVGYGILPAELIITEHYRLGSTAAILSRSFCDANRVADPETVRDIFIKGVNNIRAKENEVSKYDRIQFDQNLKIIKKKVSQIIIANN